MSMKFDDTGVTPEVLIDAANFMYGLDFIVGLANCTGLLHIAEQFEMEDLKRYIMLEGKFDEIDWVEASKLSNLMLESKKVAKKGGSNAEIDAKSVVCTAQKNSFTVSNI